MEDLLDDDPSSSPPKLSLTADTLSEVHAQVELYGVYRSYAQHEDNLINHRTTWLVTVTSFLITTLGLVFQAGLTTASTFAKLPAAERVEVADLHKALLAGWTFFSALVILAGLGTSLTALFSVRAAHLALYRLKAKWEQVEAADLLPELLGGGHRRAVVYGLHMPNVLPATFLAIWLLASLLIGAINVKCRNTLDAMRSPPQLGTQVAPVSP